MTKFSDYIVYVDESGDHGLENIDHGYPIFVLSFCIFKKADYLDAAQAFQAFKFKHHGHDMVVLHENDIRRNKKEFQFLHSRQIKEQYLEELSALMENQVFTLVASVIDKNELAKKYIKPQNPYDIATRAGLERIYRFLEEKGQHTKQTCFIFESRGKREDDELELEFRRICDGENYFKQPLPFDIVIAHKQMNSTGLQIADLTARPVALGYLKPEQKNRSFEIIRKKLRTDDNGNYDGFGLVVFPR